MGKELTLEDLAQSSKNTENNDGATKEAVNNVSKASSPATPTGSGKNAKLISTAELGKNLAIQHPEEVAAKNDTVREDSPLVQDAFDAMRNTIEERKARIAQTMPYVEENARQMASEQVVNEESKQQNTISGAPVVNINSEAGTEEENINPIPESSDWGSDFDNEDDDDFGVDMGTNLDIAIEARQNVAKAAAPVKQEPKLTPEEIQHNKQAAAAERLANEAIQSVGGLSEEDVTIHKNDEASEEEEQETSKPAYVKDENDIDVVSSNESNLDDLLKDLGIDEDDDDDYEVGEVDEETYDDLRNKFTESFKNVQIIKDPVDLNTFKFSSTPVSSSSVLKNIDNKNNSKRATWALYYTGRSVMFKECYGPELESLQKTVQHTSGFHGVLETLRFVYDHIIDANKPDFEQWTKMTRAEDIESLYFGIYRACYGDSNLVPCECKNKSCKKTSLVDIPVDDMVSFKDDDTKKEFYKIMEQDSTTSSKKITNTLLQISDDLVISYTNPTLYSTYVQLASISQDLIDKYEDIINFMAYIDSFFVINRSTSEIVPIAIKTYPKNLTKTVKVKLGAFVNVLKRLTPDQYNTLRAKLNSISNTELAVEYKIPDVNCPECGNKIAGADVDSCMSLLFTRAQLAQVQNL